ncbi:MAG: ATPase [Clostridia bacterium]|nr:ATPase [Clostridia bacterium]
MNLEDLLVQLDEVLDDGLKFPGKKTLVDAEKVRAIIDDINLNIPGEIRQARGIVEDRADIITAAKREADGIIKNAEERAKVLVSQQEIVKLSQEKATEIIASAQNKSREMRKAAQDFVDDLMRRADESITSNLGEIRKTRAALKQQVPSNRTEG